MAADQLPSSASSAKLPTKLFIVLGLSGAGKSTALSVLEDMGYFTVDGLPVSLASEVSQLMKREPMKDFPGMALGMDLREPNFIENFDDTISRLRKSGFEVTILFLEADNQSLLRRYTTTRRPHPLEKKGLGLENAIIKERTDLLPIREKADLVIDSSTFSIHDLRRQIQHQALNDPELHKMMRVNILSFGFKHSLPKDADFIFDLRFLPNPYFIPELQHLSGKDAAVTEYVFSFTEAAQMREKILDLLRFSLACMAREGRYRVTVAFGCTGGRHRSVAMAEAIAHELAKIGYSININHQHIDFHSQELHT